MRKERKRILAGVLSVAIAVSLMPTQSVAATVARSALYGAESQTQMQTDPEMIYLNSLSATKRKQNFDKNWKFYLGDAGNAQNPMFDDSKWESVNLPHDYSIKQDYSKTNEAESAYLPGGTGWYRKNFQVNESMRGKKIRIDFGGAYMNATVYVNGKQVGTHPYGYTPFSFDITDYVEFGQDNVIAVKTENRVPSSRWYSGSGLYRSVNLTVTNPLHVDLYGTKITTPNLDKEAGSTVTMQVNTKVINDSEEKQDFKIRQSLYKKGEAQVKASKESDLISVEPGASSSSQMEIPVENPDLWSVEDPNLYTLKTEIISKDQVVDSYETEYGFRWTAFDSENGFSLNGVRMKLKGVCMHHDQGALGAAAYRRAIERQVEILKEMGCNAIRVTHNPAANELIEICNEKGMMLVEEAFDTWYYAKNGNSNDYSVWFRKNIEQGNTIEHGSEDMTWAEFDVKSMVERGKNAPSIIMWSLGNEVMEGFYQPVDNYDQVAAELTKWIREVDERPVTTGDNKLKADWEEAMQIGNVLTENNGAVGFNYCAVEGYDKYHQKFPNWAIYGSETASAINSRSVYYTKGQDNATQQMTSYDTAAVGWGHVASKAWYDVIRRDFVAGEFVWTGFDYLGEPTPWNGTGSGAVGTWPSPKSSYFGIVDTAGFPKDSYYLYRSLWNKEGTTLHVLPSWSDKVVKNNAGNVDVVVYSNAPSVELFFTGEDGNRVSLGRKNYTTKTTEGGYSYQLCEGEAHQNLYMTWSVPYKPGKIEAVAYADGSTSTPIEGTIGRKKVETFGAAEKLSVSADRGTIEADGTDLCYITVDVEDAKGNLVDDAQNPISFTIEGDGEIVGVDNGNSPDHTSYQAKERNAFGGKALVIVRSTENAGEFTVRAASKGLKGAEVTVTTEKTENSSSETDVYPVSYKMSRNYYVKTQNMPQLPESIELNYSDGHKENKQLTWDSISEEEIAKTGSFIVYGQIGDTGIKAAASINMIDGVAALLNYSTAVQTGSSAILPESRPAVLLDGTILDVQFPVEWEDPDRVFDTEGTFDVKGSAEVFGETIAVNASVRVANETITIGTNVAPSALTVTQNIPENLQSDTLEAVYNKDTAYHPIQSGDKNTSCWSNFKYAQEGHTDGEIVFFYATAERLGEANIYFAEDSYSGRLPKKVELYYAKSNPEDGGEWQEIPVKEERGETKDNVTKITYQFAPVEAVYFKVKMTNSDEILGDDVKPCTMITEIELNRAVGSFEIGSTAELSELTINGQQINEKALKADTLKILDKSIEILDAKTKENASLTILEEKEGKVVLLLEAEDHSVRKTFTILLDSIPDADPEDDSNDYPYEKVMAEAASAQPGYEAAKAVDGKTTTHWHTTWGEARPLEERYIVLNLETATELEGLRYIANSGNANGRVKDYEIYVSDDGENWGDPIAKGTFANTTDWQYAAFDEAVTTSHVKLCGVHTYSGSEAADMYMNAAEIRLRIKSDPTDLSSARIEGLKASYEYHGEAIEPEISVVLGNIKLREGIDYVVQFINNDRIGTALVRITPAENSNYQGELEGRFEIVRSEEDTYYPQDEVTIRVSNAQEGYPGENANDGDEETFWHSLWAGTPEAENRWIEMAFDEPTEIGGISYLPRKGSGDGDSNGRVRSYEIRVSNDEKIWDLVGQGNWSGDDSWKDAVLKKNVTAKYIRLYGIKADSNGSAQYMNAAEIKVLRPNEESTGTDLSNAMVKIEKSRYAYTGKEIRPEVTVTLDEMVLAKDQDYVVSYRDNKEVGTARVLVTGIGDYKGSAETTFEIVEGSEADKYLLTVTNATIVGIAGEKIDPETEREIEAGAKVTIKADEAPEGMKFEEWISNPSKALPKQETVSFDMPESPMNVKAVYVKEGAEPQQAYAESKTIPGNWYAYVHEDSLDELLENPDIITEEDQAALEKGDQIKLTYTIRRDDRVTATVSDAIREEIGSAEDGRKVGYYFGGSLTKTVKRYGETGETVYRVATESDAVRVTMELPKEDKKMSDYTIVGYYEGEDEEPVVSQIAYEYDEETGLLTFAMKQNQIYGVGYTNCYNVTFLDYDGTILWEERVPHGGYATEPEVPTREGYVFVRWSREFDNVTRDMKVRALYEKKPQADFTKLNDLMQEAEQLLADLDTDAYTLRSYRKLINALAHAQSLDEYASQASVNKAYEDLKKAMDGLEKVEKETSSTGSSHSWKTNVTSSGSIHATLEVSDGTWEKDAAGNNIFRLKNGSVATSSWQYISYQGVKEWYRFDEKGIMVTGWYQGEDGNLYYLNPQESEAKGRMVTGWIWIKGEDGRERCYYFNPFSDGTRGKLVKSSLTLDGYRVNEKGEWTVNGAVQTR